MKKILSYMTVLLLLALAVSCNMDSDTGLFQEAGESVKKESYVINKVIAEDSTSSSYLVSSDEGIFIYSGKEGRKLSESQGTGKIAKNVIWGKFISSTEWECVYYDDGYHKIDQAGNVTDYTAENLSGYIMTSSLYEDGNTVVVFRKSDSTNCYVSSSSSDPSAWTPVDTSLTDVSYIGGGYFIGKDSGKDVYFKYDSSSITKLDNTNSYITYCDSVFLTKANAFYKSDSTKIDGASGNTYTKAQAFSDGTNVYFILSGLNNVYYINTSGEMKLTTKAVSSLTGIEVKYIAEVMDGEYINVITAESGAKCINLHDSRIDSSWK